MGLGQLISPLLDFCYPPRCAVCDASLDGVAALCPSCDESMNAIEGRGACDRCARPLGQWGAPCPYCKYKGLRPFDQIVALGVYEDPLKELIHRMKYNRRWGLAEELANRLLALPRTQSLMEDAEVIVPVPLHRWRQISRGYNQSSVIAHHLASRCGKKVARPLRRTRNTPSQTMIHARQERIENVRGAFRLTHPERIRGRRVVVVDDVFTTGATLQAVGRTLQEAEPANISAIVLAVADPRHRGFEAI